MRALESDPADRYQRAAEFEAALRHALDRDRPVWLWWFGGIIILLALFMSLYLSVRSLQDQSASAPTATLTATLFLSPTQTSPIPTSAPTQTPTVAATSTPVMTVTLPSQPTRTPAIEISPPWLISPPGAWTTRASRLTFRWGGELPDSNYGFRVSLYHGNNEYTSPILDGTQWTVDLPRDARDAVGEWRWSVAIVQRGETQDVTARSGAWTFYYSPFGGPSPSTSPLPGSSVSPLPTPAS